MSSPNEITREEWRRLAASTVGRWERPLDPAEPFWDPRIETAPRERIQEVQEVKLKALVRYLWTHSPFYRRRFLALGLEPGDVKGLDDLPRLPLTTKEEWSQNQLEHPPFGDYHCVRQEEWAREGWMLYSTGGTTAKPRLFTFTPYDRRFWEYTWARALWAWGVRPGEVLFNTSTYGPYPGMWGIHYGAHLLGTPIIPGGGMDTRRRLYFLKEAQATVLVGVPSYLLHMADAAREQGLVAGRDTRVRHIVTMAEPGPCVPATKRRLEEGWGGVAHDLFGHTECFPCGLGWSCAAEDHRGYDRPARDHVSEDLAIVEVVDPATCRPVSPGERGITVVTNLWSESIPALRYVMGDLMVWSEEPCACGRTFRQAAGGLLGRLDHTLRVKGVMVVPAAVEDVIRGMRELAEEFRLMASLGPSGEQLTVQAEPAPGVPAEQWAAVSRRLGDELQLVLGIRVTVEMLPHGTLPRFTVGDLHAKAQRVQDLRPTPA